MGKIIITRTKEEIFQDAYAEYVLTEDFINILLKLDEINLDLSKKLESKGIGTELLEDGTYDLESGQLLDSLNIKREDLTEQEYNLILDVALGYEDYVKQCLLEELP